ncbi:MAG TPA: ABC transporter substrate-binding protein [Chloroflexota bacterium]|nr:ABC transporter substrate-binding protein [Chloroflexota bacterium]
MNSLDHLLASVVAGNLSRREFMARAAALGIGATALAQITTALDVHAERLASGLNTLTLNAVQVFGNFDPAIGTDYTQNMAQINFYDTLLTPTPSAGLTGRLAERWTASPDATTYTFHLRKGVKFHSGNEVTAEDVVYTMERMLAINQGYSFVWQGYLMSGSVKALDRYTVQFKLLKPFAPFPSTMAVLFIVDKATVKAHQKPGKFGANGDYGQAWLGSNEAGSGPYTLESDVEGSELRMKRFPGYFRGWHAGAIDEVRVMIVEQEATVVSLAKTGVLDMTSQYQANTTYDTLKGLGFKIVTSPTTEVFYLKMNTRIAPTDDIHVRRAIALAFDYNTVRQRLYPGAPVSGPLSPAFKDAYNSSLPLPKQDLAAAKAELAKSKYAGKGAIPLTLSYVTTAPFEAQIALLFNSIMSQIGFKVTINPQQWNRITELATKVQDTPNVTEVFYDVLYPSPDSMFFQQYDSKANGSWASMEWLDDPVVDSLIAKSRLTVDNAKRNAIYKQIQARIVDLQPDAFMLAALWRQAVRPAITGTENIYMPAGAYQFYNLKKS